MKTTKSIFLFLALVFITSCEKETEPTFQEVGTQLIGKYKIGDAQMTIDTIDGKFVKYWGDSMPAYENQYNNKLKMSTTAELESSFGKERMENVKYALTDGDAVFAKMSDDSFAVIGGAGMNVITKIK